MEKKMPMLEAEFYFMTTMCKLFLEVLEDAYSANNFRSKQIMTFKTVNW